MALRRLPKPSMATTLDRLAPIDQLRQVDELVIRGECGADAVVHQRGLNRRLRLLDQARNPEIGGNDALGRKFLQCLEDRLPPGEVTAWTRPSLPRGGERRGFCFSPRARMLAFSSAEVFRHAEGGVLRTLVGDGTSLSSGMWRTAGGLFMECFPADGRTEPSRRPFDPSPSSTRLSLSVSARSAQPITELQCRNPWSRPPPGGNVA